MTSHLASLSNGGFGAGTLGMTYKHFNKAFLNKWLCLISKIQLVVYYQCYVLIGWATTRLYVIAHWKARAFWRQKRIKV